MSFSFVPFNYSRRLELLVMPCSLLCRFPCGRWLGRDADDGSTERLLVGEYFEESDDVLPCESRLKIKTPPRARSPSLPRKSYESRMNVSDIQEFLGTLTFLC